MDTIFNNSHDAAAESMNRKLLFELIVLKDALKKSKQKNAMLNKKLENDRELNRRMLKHRLEHEQFMMDSGFKRKRVK